MSASPRFFLHFLNSEVLRLYGVRPSASATILRNTLALGRAALFLSDEPILIPPASLFEMDCADQFIAALKPATEIQLVEYVSPTADLGDYAVKKQREYRDQRSLSSKYAITVPQIDEHSIERLVWRPRVRLSASREITRVWLEQLVAPEGLGHTLLTTRSRRSGSSTTKLEAQLASIPSLLEGRAFIPENVATLLPGDITSREATRIALLISNAYVSSFIEEYRAAILVDTPFGALDCGISAVDSRGERITYPFRRLRDVLRLCSLPNLLDTRMPLEQLLELKYQPIGVWFRSLVIDDIVSGGDRLRTLVADAGHSVYDRRRRSTDLKRSVDALHRLYDRVTPLLNTQVAGDTLGDRGRRSPTASGTAMPLSPPPHEGHGPGDRTREATKSMNGVATIGIVLALPKEFAAAEAVFGAGRPWWAPGKGAGRRYNFANVAAQEGGEHIVALALMSDMGNNSAAIRAMRLMEHCPNVKHIIMCGIAGGIPTPATPEQYAHLGDVVVSNEYGVVQYDFVKEEADIVHHRHRPRPPAAELIEAVRYLEAARLTGRRPWEKFVPLGETVMGARRPDDRLDAAGQPIDYPADPTRGAGELRVFSAPIASANRLLKDPTHRDALHKKFGVLAVEMESSGIADVTWTMDRGYLTVRSICDYCDPAKGDVWQGFAAVAAASYVRALIESMPGLNP